MSHKHLGVAIVALIVLLFGGFYLANWSAGVFKTIKGNRAAEVQLQDSVMQLEAQKGETTRVLDDYARTQDAVRGLAQQIQGLRQSAESSRQAAQQKDQTITQLRESVKRLEQERSSQMKVTTLEEAKNALGTYAPAYR